MTRRERLEARIERRRQWAESRRADAAAQHDRAQSIIAHIPPGQPILVGHHSERRHRRDLARHDAAMSRSIESTNMAKQHDEKASGLAEQLDASIFSDDVDAVEQLKTRIEDREAERDRIKAYNSSCRKGTPDESLLDERQRENIATVRRVCSYQLGQHGEYPAYALSNLPANIKRDRDRLKVVEARQARAQRAAEIGGILMTGGEQVAITFAQKPAREILDQLKAAGFRWSNGSWCGLRTAVPASVAALVPVT